MGASSPLSLASVLLQRYRVLSLLGEGTSGWVYLVEDEQSGRQQVALKLLKPHLLATPVEHLLEHEFRMLTQLQHPYIAKVFDFGRVTVTHELLYLTSEYVQGEDLFTASRGATLDAVLNWTVEICLALEYLAARGVVHGDLKPGNILMQKRAGEIGIKIVDFGIASEFSSAPTANNPARYGTPQYMAPEIIGGQAVDQRTDLYALGAILYRLSTGEFVFDRTTPAEVMQAHMETPPHPPRHWNAQIPEALERLILRLLEKDPAQRYFRAQQVIDAIYRISPQAKANQMLSSSATPSHDLDGIPMAGRDEVLKTMQQISGRVFSASPHGRQVVFVSAEAGLGKTRLLRSLKNNLLLRHIPVLMASPSSSTGTLAQLLKPLILQAPETLRQRYHAALARLQRPASVANAQNDRQHLLEDERYFDDLSQFLIEVSEHIGPAKTPGYALLLDDLHHFQDEEIQLLLYFYRTLRQTKPTVRILLVATGLADAAPLNEILQDPQVEHIVLQPLDLDEIQQVLTTLAAGQSLSEKAPVVERLTSGNPLGLQYLLANPGDWEDLNPGELKIPPSIEQASLRIFNRLTSDEKLLLQILALWDGAIGIDDLAALTHSDQTTRTLRSLQHKNLLHLSRDQGAFLYKLSSESFGKALKDQMPAKIRRELHRQIAEYEQMKSTDLRSIERLAAHFAGAENAALAFQYGVEAARLCIQSRALKAALVHYEHALQFLPALSSVTLHTQAQIYGERGRIFSHRGEFEQAITSLTRALELLKGAGAPALEQAYAARRLGEVYQHSGQAQLALGFLDESLRLLPADAPATERLMTLWMKGRALYTLGQYERLYTEADTALNSAPTSADRVIVSHLVNRGLGNLYLGRYPQALADFQESLQKCRAANLHHESTYALNGLGMASIKQGEADAAVGFFKQAFEQAQKTQDRRLQITFLMNIGTICHQTREYGQALDYYRRALEIAERIHHTSEMAKILSNLGLLYLQFEDGERGRELIGRSLIFCEQHRLREVAMYNRLFLADYDLHRGAADKAYEQFTATLEAAQALHYPEQEIHSLHGLAGALALAGDFDEAVDHLRDARELCDKIENSDAWYDHGLCTAKIAMQQIKLDPDHPDRTRILNSCRTALAGSKNIADIVGDPYRLWKILNECADLETLAGDSAAAAKYRKQAGEFFDDYKATIPEEFRGSFTSAHRL